MQKLKLGPAMSRNKANEDARCRKQIKTRDWQCRGQSFLLLVLSKDNVLLQSSLCSNGCGTDLVMNMTFAYAVSGCERL